MRELFLCVKRRLQVAALVLAALMICACAVAEDAGVVPASAVTVTPSIAATPAASGAELAPAAPAPATPAVAAAEDGFADGFLLGIGDRISINVLGEKDLSMEVLVDGQGSINYPFLGEIRVAGLTVNALRDEIGGRLAPDYLLDPQVTVQVLEYRKFFVNGEVQRPGGFPWQPGMTVRKAAALAGGFTPRASRSRLFIIREVDAARQPAQITIDAPVAPGDILTIDQSFF
jgi:protein involved in polysaccharide export with SLBB domain